MPNPPLQPPAQPLALRRSHLLSPAPDRLTNTPTTLRIIRENTLSGRDFKIYRQRSDEEVASPRRSTLLYAVIGRLWSNSQHREIRDSSGRALLELRRIWWRGSWSVRRPGGAGDDLLSAELRWGIGMKLAVRFENALVSGRWDADELVNMNLDRGARGQQGGENSGVYARRGVGVRRHTHSYSRSTPPFRRRQEQQQQQQQEEEAPPPYTPPSYSAVLEEDDARRERERERREEMEKGEGEGGGGGGGPLPSYESVRRLSSTSLRDLLDAIEPPGEPAPASTTRYPPPRPRSEGGVADRVNANVELKVAQLSGTGAQVTMGEKRIIHVRRERALDPNTSGSMPRWEVEVAEGVDLLLAVSIVLIIAEGVKHEYRPRTN